MATEIKTKHSGIEIVYDEASDRWLYELRGKERSSDTLALAKVAIDAPPPKDKKPFAKVRAYWVKWGEILSGTVTSIAQQSRYGSTGTQVWFVHDDKKQWRKREKVRLAEICPMTDENTASVQRVEEIERQIADLEKEATAIKDAMKRLVIEPKQHD